MKMTGMKVTSASVSGSRLIRARLRLVSTSTAEMNSRSGLRPSVESWSATRSAVMAVMSCFLDSALSYRSARSRGGVLAFCGVVCCGVACCGVAGQREEDGVQRRAPHRHLGHPDALGVQRPHYVGGQAVGHRDGPPQD